jgi:hypothetical protein
LSRGLLSTLTSGETPDGSDRNIQARAEGSREGGTLRSIALVISSLIQYRVRRYTV